MSGTDTLIQEAKKLGLDPRPFEAVAAVVYSWNHPYYIDEPLDRERLRAMFDTALAALPEIEEAIRRHEAKQWAELAPRPIVPVVLNGRTHTTNGGPTGHHVSPGAHDQRHPTGRARRHEDPEEHEDPEARTKGQRETETGGGTPTPPRGRPMGSAHRQIFEGGGSEASRYRLLNEENGDDEVKEWLSRYKHRGLGKTPPSVDDL